MPFKPNYRMQRADRQRAKEQKLEKKLQRRAERAADPSAPADEAPAAAVDAADKTDGAGS